MAVAGLWTLLPQAHLRYPKKFLVLEQSYYTCHTTAFVNQIQHCRCYPKMVDVHFYQDSTSTTWMPSLCSFEPPSQTLWLALKYAHAQGFNIREAQRHAFGVTTCY